MSTPHNMDDLTIITTKLTVYVSGVGLSFGGFLLENWQTLIGGGFMLLTYITNFIFLWRRDRREREKHSWRKK